MKKICFTNGCFDILHVGHLALFDKCNKLEDIKLNIGVTYNYEDTRWNTTDVDLNNFNNLKNLKNSVNNEDFK